MSKPPLSGSQKEINSASGRIRSAKRIPDNYEEKDILREREEEWESEEEARKQHGEAALHHPPKLISRRSYKDLLTTGALLSLFFILPFEVAFVDTPGIPDAQDPLCIYNRCIDAIFIIDLVITYLTAYGKVSTTADEEDEDLDDDVRPRSTRRPQGSRRWSFVCISLRSTASRAGCCSTWRPWFLPSSTCFSSFDLAMAVP